MTFDWGDYLTIADQLACQGEEAGPQEACFRAAISRSYYAAFISSRNVARDKDDLCLTDTGTDHARVRDHYQYDPHRRKQKVGSDLGKLKKRRESADYDDVLSGNPRSMAISSVQVARNVLHNLQYLATLLGNLLISEGLIDRARLVEALEAQKQSAKLLGQVLVEAGAISEERLRQMLELQGKRQKP